MQNNYYDDSLSQQIIDKADIVSIIGEYIKLDKKGSDYKGLCPFHDDHHASLSVSPQKKCFNCFSCGVKGNVITFVSKIKNISKREAMRIVGETCGIQVRKTKKDLERQKNEKYYKIMNDASEFYSFFLKNSNTATQAKNYLHQRGLEDDVIAKFKIGLSGDQDELYKVLKSKGHLEVDMLEVGLIRRFGNTYKDAFKNRIIFPLWDLDGYVVGFSGRRYLPNDNESKYMNTNETVIFKKGQILYNYSVANSQIRHDNCVYLFEGFMDAIASVRAGLVNSVASMGTALTNYQIEAIKRLTNNVTIVYDSDEPGFEATRRAIDMFNSYSMNVTTVTIPDVKDADEYILKYGKEKLNDILLHSKVSAMDFVYNRFAKTTLFTDINSKEDFKNKVYAELSKYKSNLLIESFINKLSKDLQISVEALKEDFKQFVNDNPVKQIYSNKPAIINNDPIDFSDFSIPSEEIDVPLPEELINNIDNKEIVVKKPNEKKLSIRKYLDSEKQLILASYYEKEKCLQIESELEFASVDKVNGSILFKLREYYRKREIVNPEELFMTLNDDEKSNLVDIINNVKAPTDEIIKINIKLVKEYPTILSIENSVNDGRKKDIEDLKNLANAKKKVTQLKIKGRK